MNTKKITLVAIGTVVIVVALVFLTKPSNDTVQTPDEASAESVAVEVGDNFPDFQLLEANNIKIIPEIFFSDPTIVWFTTSWCVPCQIGAREVAELDDELGGEAFDVFVVFVDPRESREDLINWRSTYANPDWLVALDDSTDSLAEKLDIKFLDTKYLLDKNGVIQDIDERQVTSAYLELIRAEVAEN